MQQKTIKKILQAKLDKWVESVDDNKVSAAIKRSAIVTGGSIASLFLNEEVNDYDIYFKNEKDLVKVIEYYTKDRGLTHTFPGKGGIEIVSTKEIEIEGEHGKETVYARLDGGVNIGYDKEIEVNSFVPLFFSPNAITLSDDIQIVNRFYGSIDEIHKNYDFVHATNAYDYEKNELILRIDAQTSLLSKQLFYVGSKYPLTSIIRSKKFVKRGFNISAGEYVKMALQLNEHDLYDPEVLREQLIGVDIAYFKTLIEAFKGIRQEDLSYRYISAVIDKIFN